VGAPSVMTATVGHPEPSAERMSPCEAVGPSIHCLRS
jgi:hypothetical protein